MAAFKLPLIVAVVAIVGSSLTLKVASESLPEPKAEHHHTIGSGQPNVFEIGQAITNADEERDTESVVAPAAVAVELPHNKPENLGIQKCVPTGQACSIGQQCCTKEMCPHPPFKMVCNDKSFSP